MPKSINLPFSPEDVKNGTYKKPLEYNRDENCEQALLAIEFHMWLKTSSVGEAEIPLPIKWRMFCDQKNARAAAKQEEGGGDGV